MNSYHLQCGGYRNHAEEVYVCSYCQLLVGGSIPHNGGGFLVCILICLNCLLIEACTSINSLPCLAQRHNGKYLDLKLLFELVSIDENFCVRYGIQVTI